MKKLLFILATILLCSYDTVEFNYLPTSESVIFHSYYSLEYSEEHEQAKWVAYELTPANFRDIDRKSGFVLDKSVSTRSASSSDYTNSGYDRGHLCPAADMRINEESMNQSFYMSNVSPQDPGFNRGIWKSLESTFRFWAEVNGHLYVVTGPVFKDNKGSIGDSEVTVPGYFYKIAFDYTGEDYKMIAFVLPNEKLSGPVSRFAVSVDSVEYLTGIDFFPHLIDELEDELESNYNYEDWTD